MCLLMLEKSLISYILDELHGKRCLAVFAVDIINYHSCSNPGAFYESTDC
jgi:hypothetical protein